MSLWLLFWDRFNVKTAWLCELLHISSDSVSEAPQVSFLPILTVLTMSSPHPKHSLSDLDILKACSIFSTTCGRQEDNGDKNQPGPGLGVSVIGQKQHWMVRSKRRAQYWEVKANKWEAMEIGNTFAKIVHLSTWLPAHLPSNLSMYWTSPKRLRYNALQQKEKKRD